MPPDADYRRDFTADKRKEMAKAGTAMPDGSFPIENGGDLKNAITAIGRANPARRQAVKRHIIKRARALGLTDQLPEAWRSLNAMFPPDEQPQMRSAGLTEVEIASDGKLFRGYAAVFDVVADLADGLTESVAHGAFRKVLKDESMNVPFLYDHGGPPMMTTAAGTLRLSEDTKGLEVEGDLPEHHTHVRMLREQVDRGEVAGMSWGFVIGPGHSRIEQRGNGIHRELLGFKRLLDVSPTWDPAYAETDLELRAMRYNFIADLYDVPQQFAQAEHQEQDDGAEREDADEEQHEEEQEEQQSGATEVVAARNAQLDTLEREMRFRERQAVVDALEMQVPREYRVRE